MNIQPVNIAAARCGPGPVSCRMPTTSGTAAIQAVLVSNIGKTVTVYTDGMNNAGGFTGVLSSMGGGAINLITPYYSGYYGGSVSGVPTVVYPCRHSSCGCPQPTRCASSNIQPANTSLTVPIGHITAVACPSI